MTENDVKNGNGWIRSKPQKSNLSITFQRDDYIVYGGLFLVTDGKQVYLAAFTMPPKTKNGYYEGYWEGDIENKILGWQPLPDAKIE